jgi:hypothetical protein
MGEGVLGKPSAEPFGVRLGVLPGPVATDYFGEPSAGLGCVSLDRDTVCIGGAMLGRPDWIGVLVLVGGSPVRRLDGCVGGKFATCPSQPELVKSLKAAGNVWVLTLSHNAVTMRLKVQVVSVDLAEHGCPFLCG